MQLIYTLSYITGSDECAEMLLKWGARPAALDDWRQTPLMYCICTERDNLVELITNYNCNIDARVTYRNLCNDLKNYVSNMFRYSLFD